MVQLNERTAERERRLWDSQAGVVVGFVAQNLGPAKRRELLAALEAARSGAYPALPAPDQRGGESIDTPDSPATDAPGTAETAAPLEGRGDDTMDSGRGAVAVDGGSSPSPAPPAPPAGPAQDEPNRAAGRRGDGSRDEILPEGSQHERGRGRYGDEPPW